MTADKREINSHFKAKDKEIFKQAKSYACDYMESAYDRNVYPSNQAIENLKVFEEPMPDQMGDGQEIIRMLHEYGSPATVTQTGGRYFGFVNGSAYPAALAAKWLSDVWDQNPALFVISPIVSKLEEICEKWLVELLGLPQNTVAGLVGGTSTATMCGLAAGRLALYKHLNWDINQKGMIGAPAIRVIVGKQVHATVFKALALLGFGKENIELIPANHQGRIDISQMPELDDKTLLVIQAGNVNSGAFDPIQEICKKANDAGAWVHIDGAFGLWAAASSEYKHLTAGLEMADSWSVDGHKTLNTPYDCGIILCKHRDTLVESMQASGSYIQYGEQRDGMLYTPEMSRRSRSVELWATLKFLGKFGVEALVNSLCENAKKLADRLQDNDFNIHNDVVFNQILVSCGAPELTSKTLINIQSSGECWCGASIWNDKPVIRLSVCSWKTSESDLDNTVSCFVEARRKAKTSIA